jgi:hypothetical protein
VTTTKFVRSSGQIVISATGMASVEGDCTCPQLTGKYKCIVSSGKIVVYGFDLIPAGTALSITIASTNSAATSGSFCIDAYEDYPTVTKLVQEQSCATLTYTVTPSPTWFECTTWYKARRVQATEVAPLTFYFTLTTTINMLNDYIEILDPTNSFANTATKDFKCTINYMVARDCYYENSPVRRWFVQAPRETNLVAGVRYKLRITTQR